MSGEWAERMEQRSPVLTGLLQDVHWQLRPLQGLLSYNTSYTGAVVHVHVFMWICKFCLSGFDDF